MRVSEQNKCMIFTGVSVFPSSFYLIFKMWKATLQIVGFSLIGFLIIAGGVMYGIRFVANPYHDKMERTMRFFLLYLPLGGILAIIGAIIWKCFGLEWR